MPASWTLYLDLEWLVIYLIFFFFDFLKAEMKLKEEEQRAVRYLETRKGCDSVTVVSYMYSIHVVLILY